MEPMPKQLASCAIKLG